MAARELADFLRERRERIHPSDVGLATTTRRRTPGLRRDEVASLARMSTDYYTELEKARGARPSREMLDSMAKALRLSRAEHAHLHQLAGESAPLARRIVSVAPDTLLALLDRLTDTAVLVLDAKQEVVAWNALTGLVMGDLVADGPRWRNLARRFFLHPDPHKQHFGISRSDVFAVYSAADLRASQARYPHDEELAALIAELRAGSAWFERLWQTRQVDYPSHMVKKLTHPTAGPIFLSCNQLLVPECDLRAVLFTARPRTRSARVLREMARSIPRAQRGTRRL